MKSLIIPFLTILLAVNVWAQKTEQPIGPLTMGNAPAFKANSTMGVINFPDDYFGKWKIILCHPADFTPVSATELIALAMMQDEFASLKTVLLALSTDGINSHLEWVKTLDTHLSDSGVKIGFPLIADNDYKISSKYGVLRYDTINGLPDKTIRGVIFIDPSNKIRAFFSYPINVARNLEEIKRTLIAMQTEDKFDVLIPAGWKPGDEVLIKSPLSIAEANKLEAMKKPGLRKVFWYLWYKRL